MMNTIRNAILTLAFSMTGSASAAGVSTLLELAEIVVVGRSTLIARTEQGVSGSVRVERILKGTVNQSSIAVEIPPFRKGAVALVRFDEECGMWFLLPIGGGKWGPVSKQPGSAYFPLPTCSEVNSFGLTLSMPLADRIALELASAAESFHGGRRYAGDLYSIFGGVAPAAKSKVAARFVTSQNPDLLATGLALQIQNQDPGALRRMEVEAGLFAKSDARSGLYRAVSTYRSPLPVGVHVLGRLATQSGPGPTAFLVGAAVEALVHIHTREALPYLMSLLDSAEALIRNRAVAGLSLFRLNIPANLSDKELWGAVGAKLNPGLTTLTLKEREFIQLGGFANPAEEMAHISFYKSWWLENRARLGF